MKAKRRRRRASPHPNHMRNDLWTSPAWLTRTQPATVTRAFAANHIASLGQARDEMERKR